MKNYWLQKHCEKQIATKCIDIGDTLLDDAIQEILAQDSVMVWSGGGGGAGGGYCQTSGAGGAGYDGMVQVYYTYTLA